MADETLYDRDAESQTDQGTGTDQAGDTDQGDGAATISDGGAQAQPRQRRASVKKKAAEEGVDRGVLASATIQPGAGPEDTVQPDPEHSPNLSNAHVVTDIDLAAGNVSAVQQTLAAGGLVTQVQPANAAEADKLVRARREGASTTIEVAPPAGGPSITDAQTGALALAAPAPLPRPEDPSLTAGTEHAFQRSGSKGQQEPD